MMAIGGSGDANRRAVRLARTHDALWAAAGYDRDEAPAHPSLAQLEELLAEDRVTAIGEIGLDYHYHPETRKEQVALFDAQLEMAVRRNVPVVVHSRKADQDTLDLLENFTGAWRDTMCPPGVLHCFAGTPEFAEKLLELGMMISFSGIVTFRNADAVRQAAAITPDDRLMVETDSPYLSPEPYRGKTNEPARVVHVGAALAEIRRCAACRIADITTCNAIRLFQMQPG
jgi:TatD DNase family protein